MKCPGCGFENAAGMKFCGECGGALALKCRSCGFENLRGMKFCGECGKSLADPAAPVRSPDPRSYTPRHLAEKILTSRSALEGERKQVTILFADVRGSTELASELDPEEWHRVMDRFFQILAEGVHRFEGTVNEYRGDGIMALFGAPIAHEDHAARGCYAALALQEDLRRYANELRLQKGINFSVLNSGEVVVGKIGDDLRMDYTALGHTASLAARMEQIAAPDRAYLTEHTAKLIEGLVQLEDLGKVAVKGAKEPLQVYELRGIGRLRTKLEVSRARGFSKFVGRHREMALLEDALERARAQDEARRSRGSSDPARSSCRSDPVPQPISIKTLFLKLLTHPLAGSSREAFVPPAAAGLALFFCPEMTLVRTFPVLHPAGHSCSGTCSASSVLIVAIGTGR